MVSSVQSPYDYATRTDESSRPPTKSRLRSLYSTQQRHVLRVLTTISASCIRAAAILRVERSVSFAVKTTDNVLSTLSEASRVVAAQAARWFPSLARFSAASAAEAHEVDHVGQVLSDFDKLSRDQQDRVAKSLALLWDAFESGFGGVSAFRSASLIDQQGYTERLAQAAHRMEAARGSAAAFHYVTVELMRQYVSFFQTGSEDPRAIALASRVAPLIDHGRRMNAEAA